MFRVLLGSKWRPQCSERAQTQYLVDLNAEQIKKFGTHHSEVLIVSIVRKSFFVTLGLSGYIFIKRPSLIGLKLDLFYFVFEPDIYHYE